MTDLKLIDAHIHLDHYQDVEINQIIQNSEDIEALLSVSYHLESCKRNLELAKQHEKVKAAFGFHPEQKLPSDHELQHLIDWIAKHNSKMVAIGEVGLPFYMKKEGKVSEKEFGQYVELLETFVIFAKKWDLPIALHAVYEDAPIVCNLLEKHSVKKAHFHWFKGDEKTTERMIKNGYFISVTPEVVYREKIQKLTEMYPLEQLMVETDGPWPFDGQFKGKMTHPNMMKDSIATISEIKKTSNLGS